MIKTIYKNNKNNNVNVKIFRARDQIYGQTAVKLAAVMPPLCCLSPPRPCGVNSRCQAFRQP